ncbi:methyltransferase domain-containing protein [Nonomuraea phyllanthi]|uniref:Methyltransferase domain-containing protein n=1 Tax=Nonomuraea phyllanthi TaxID=2219224 RepID=A0A5C4WQ20_9ACTN|nr:methyltransferase domain-containing protein [Nonomuraea phyllanthi]KAB8195138.1 methyltransferase domain-containing protein [Nonomuraea phyllanthi]
MASVYDSERLAAGYAFDRPQVHRHILAPVRLRRPAGRALDIGCGAGVSTAALAPLAEHVVGLEPVPAMLAHRRSVAPSARFAVGAAERLPFAAASFEEFRRRFPSPGGWRPLAVEELPLAGTGLRLLDHGDVEIPVPMALDDYLRYVLSEAGVDSAIACGAVTAGQARDWCRRTLAEVFRGGERAVVFRGYLATLAPDARD